MRRSSLLLLVALALPASVAQADGPENDGVAAVDFGEWDWQVPEVAAPPMQLTASDGTGLRMTALDARVVVQGPLAYTELHLAFNNPEQRVREGRFEITLPDGAAISRFAMKIGGQWQEGEVVEQTLARRAYEDFLHRRQDPALLENDAGNQFRARVFPIQPGEDKELILSYSQELTSADGLYRLPTAGLPALDRFDVTVSIDTVGRSRETLDLHRTGTAPEGHVVVATNGPSIQQGLRHDELAMARVVPRLREEPVPLTELTVLLDTSASRALSLEADIERVQRVLSELVRTEGDIPVRVVAFDQDVLEVYSGPASDFGAVEARALGERGAFGASDLARALRSLGRAPRVLVVTDGVGTSGETDSEAIAATLRNAGNHGVTRVDVMTSGGIRDIDQLEGLVRTLPRAGTVIDGDLSAAQAARRLTLAVYDLTVDVPGADWVWPTVLRGVQPGDARTVFAQVGGTGMSVRLDGQDVGPIAMDEAPGPLLQREWVQARMERLESMAQATDDADEAAAYRGQVTRLSTEHRVLTDTTSLLVLETESDYARFGIDRNALADVLVVEDGALASVSRPGRELPVTGGMPVEQQWDGVDAVMDDAEQFEPLRSGDTEVSRDEVASTRMDFDSGGIAPPSPTMASTETLLSQQARRAAPRSPSDAFTGAVAEERMEVGDQVVPEPQADVPMQATSVRGLPRSIGEARALVDAAPGDVLALLDLATLLERDGQTEAAARVIGSIIDLFPSRADMRRMAGQRLDALGDAAADLALDSYEVALEQRPDHPSSHRQVALALVRQARYAEAFDVLEASLQRAYPGNRFAGVDRVMRDDIGLVAAAWVAQDSSVRADVQRRLSEVGASLATDPSMRFVLTWETDANDVDLHVYDAKGNHAWYSDKRMASGGELYADVTTGFGPECFAVTGATKGPYRVQAHYYSQGPMGYGMGTLHIIHHDGHGKLVIEDQPFVVESDGAWLELGSYAAL